MIGGAHVFREFLPFADKVELTEILEEIEGDTMMEDPRASGDWRETFREDHDGR